MLTNHPIVATIPTRDMDRARQFYEGVLSLTPSDDEAGGITYHLGGGTAAFLYPTQAAGTAQHTLMAWRVSDLDAVVDWMRSRGVQFEEYDYPDLHTVNGIADMGGERVAWFKDPDGNILAVGSPSR